jgi:glucosamine 6-phosphate synthetase-like amidotransferase/phosphosugar isomerase protein
LDCTDTSTLVVVITGSTGYPALFEGLREAAKRGAFTLGVTNHEGTPVSTGTTDHLLIPATRIGWPTQISTAQIAALLRLGLVWSEREGASELRALPALPSIVRRVIDDQDIPMRELAAHWCDRSMFLFAASGPAYAAARMGSAKIKEMSQDHVCTMYLEEYHHYYPVKKGEAFFLLAPGGTIHNRAVDTARDAAAEQADLVILRPSGDRTFDEFEAKQIALPDIPEGLSSIIYAIPLHLFAQHLAILKQRPEWTKQDHQGRRIKTPR